MISTVVTINHRRLHSEITIFIRTYQAKIEETNKI